MGPHGTNLVLRFRRLEESGAIEIITCGATHGYLPLLSDARSARSIAVATTNAFGRAPRGIWLPECAYRPAGPWHRRWIPSSRVRARDRGGARRPRPRLLLRRLVTCSRAAQPLGVYADRFDALRHAGARRRREQPSRPPHVPIAWVAAATVACFGRDRATAAQVWSGEQGYPGDGAYLDFHKKRIPGGHRYWAVTHPRADPRRQAILRSRRRRGAPARTRAHFVALVEGGAARIRAHQSRRPIVCAMYDTELFGHWWFEGPRFLAAVLDRCAEARYRADHGRPSPRTPPARRNRRTARRLVGRRRRHDVWLNDQTAWTWPHVHSAERSFERLARGGGIARVRSPARTAAASDRPRDAVARSLGLAIPDHHVSARDYAERRLTGHADDCSRVALAAQRVCRANATSPEGGSAVSCSTGAARRRPAPTSRRSISANSCVAGRWPRFRAQRRARGAASPETCSPQAVLRRRLRVPRLGDGQTRGSAPGPRAGSRREPDPGCARDRAVLAVGMKQCSVLPDREQLAVGAARTTR